MARLEQQTVRKQGLQLIVAGEVAQGVVEEDGEGIMVGEMNKTRKTIQATVVWTAHGTRPSLRLEDWVCYYSN